MKAALAALVRVFAAACAVFASSPLVRAQTPDATPDRAVQLISFFMIGGKETVIEGEAPDAKAAFKFRADRTVHDFVMSPGQFGGPFLRSAQGTVELFREKPSADPAKPPQVVPIAQADFPASWRNIMVLVSVDTGGAIRLRTLDQSLSSLPPGEVSFINTTPIPLAVKLGSANGLVPPQERLRLTTGITGDQAQMVRLLVAAEVEGEGRVINSTSVALAPKERGLVLLYPGQIRPVQVLFLPSAPADPKQPEKAN